MRCRSYSIQDSLRAVPLLCPPSHPQLIISVLPYYALFATPFPPSQSHPPTVQTHTPTHHPHQSASHPALGLFPQPPAIPCRRFISSWRVFFGLASPPEGVERAGGGSASLRASLLDCVMAVQRPCLGSAPFHFLSDDTRRLSMLGPKTESCGTPQLL